MLHGHLTSFPCSLGVALLANLIAVGSPAFGQSLSSAKPTERPALPTRDPHTPGYVTAKELPDGTNPPQMRTETSSSGPPTTSLRARLFRRPC
jgi:hypothetical protein